MPFDLPGHIIIDLDSQSLSLLRITDVLDTGSSIGKDGVADSMLVSLLNADICEIHNLREVAIRFRAKETSPPPSLLREAGEVKSLLENDLAVHCDSMRRDMLR